MPRQHRDTGAPERASALRGYPIQMEMAAHNPLEDPEGREYHRRTQGACREVEMSRLVPAENITHTKIPRRKGMGLAGGENQSPVPHL